MKKPFDTISPYVYPLLKNVKKTDVTHTHIIESVIEVYNVSQDNVMSKSREACYREPRQVAIYFCEHVYKIGSLAFIGSIFGKDHATVIHCVKVVNNMKFRNYLFIDKLEKINALIKHKAINNE